MEIKETKNILEIESTPINKNSKSNKFLLDELIDTLSFSRYNLAIIFICILTNINNGYFTIYLKFNEKTFLNTSKWTKFEYNTIVVGQHIFYSIGAVLSVYARTSYWDISSNSLIAIIEFLSTLMLLTFSDSLIFMITLVFYCFCQGYLSNLSTNYLLEISPKDQRGGLFILVSSCYFLGQAIFGFVAWCISNFIKASDPNILLIGLVISSALLSIASLLLVDSPRVLFYNNHTIILIQVMHYYNSSWSRTLLMMRKFSTMKNR